MAANRYTIKPHDTSDSTMLVMLKPREKALVALAQREEADDRDEINDVVHILSFKATAVTRFSARRGM